MKPNLKLIAVGVSGVILSACGGSDGGDEPASRQTFAELEAAEDVLRDETTALAIIEPMDLPSGPTAGSATYDGTIGFIVGEGTADELRFLGDLSLTADFSADTIGGNASDFVDETEAQYSGSLDVDGGEIDRTTDTMNDYTFDAFLEGVLTSPTGDEYASVAEIRGEFLGPTVDDPDTHVGGAVRGAFRKNDVTVLEIFDEGRTPVDNVFYGSR